MGSIVSSTSLQERRSGFRKTNKKVVFTNGCFDILHRGHVEYLEKAKALGDVLIVGINSDDSTRRIKGEKRPVVPASERAFVVSRLASVDYVCIVDDDTPEQLVRAIVPDVLVKGADWKLGEIVGKDIVEAAGGHVATVELTEGLSTTNIISRIRSLYC